MKIHRLFDDYILEPYYMGARHVKPSVNRRRHRRIAPSMMLALLLAVPPTILLMAGCGSGESQEETAEAKQLYTCSMHPQVIQDKPGNCPICGMKLVPVKQQTSGSATTAANGPQTGKAATGDKKGRKILYWRAPMDPTYIRSGPGKSPMGMDLVPVYEGDAEAAGGPTVVIDPVTIQDIGVQTATVKRVHLNRIIRTVGHVDYNEEQIHRVNIKFSGWIEKLYVDETGQQVKRGQPMMDIYSPDLVTTQEEYLLALRNREKLREADFGEVRRGSESLLEATRRRLLYWDITEQQIKDLERTGKVQKTVTLYAPVNGVVISKMAESGMRVMPGMDLYRIADLSTVWIYAHIYDYEVPWVRKGQPVVMDLPYIPGKFFRGTVNYVYPYLDEKTRDIKVRLIFDNPGLEMKPQMYANVQLESHLGRVIAVPEEAVIRSGKRNVMFVALGGGRFLPRDVTLGPEGQDGLVQVISGVDEGEVVVTSAQFMLDSESRLKEAIQKMLEANHPAAQQERHDMNGGEGEMQMGGHDAMEHGDSDSD